MVKLTHVPDPKSWWAKTTKFWLRRAIAAYRKDKEPPTLQTVAAERAALGCCHIPPRGGSKGGGTGHKGSSKGEKGGGAEPDTGTSKKGGGAEPDTGTSEKGGTGHKGGKKGGGAEPDTGTSKKGGGSKGKKGGGTGTEPGTGKKGGGVGTEPGTGKKRLVWS